MVEGSEQCDDGEMTPTAGDGCDGNCQVEKGWDCDMGMPTVCTPIMPETFSMGPGIGMDIPDDGYMGPLNTMACIQVPVTTQWTEIQSVRVTVGADHTWVGDLTIKVRSPAMTVARILSRPGMNEPADDGTDCIDGCNNNSDWGDGSNLGPNGPVNFFEGATDSAELMGSFIGGSTVCVNSGSPCDWDPAPDALTVFDAENANGTWEVCVGDAAPTETGSIDQVVLEILSY